MVAKYEDDEILREIGGPGKKVGLFTDATNAKCEYMVIGVRFIYDPSDSDEIEPQQRILDLLMTEGHHNAHTAAGGILRAITKFGIAPGQALAHSRDTVSMNGAADTILRQLGNFENLVSLLCIGHLGANAGNEMLKDGGLPVLSSFWKALQNVLRSAEASELWKGRTGQAFPSYSEIKWFSKFDSIEHCMVLYGDVVPWVTELFERNIAKESTPKLLQLVTHPGLLHYLKIEMSVYLFVGRPLRNLTYMLEGDGELAFTAYEVVNEQMGTFDGQWPPMPEVERLAQDAIVWSQSTEGAAELVICAQELDDARTAADAPPPAVVAPPRARRALSAGGHAAATRIRTDAAAELAKQAAKAELERKKELAEAALLAKLAAVPPQDVEGWVRYAQSEVESAPFYFHSRLKDEAEYAPQMRLFEAAGIFHPRTLASTSIEEGRRRLNLLRGHPHFDADAAIEALVA